MPDADDVRGERVEKAVMRGEEEVVFEGRFVRYNVGETSSRQRLRYEKDVASSLSMDTA